MAGYNITFSSVNLDYYGRLYITYSDGNIRYVEKPGVFGNVASVSIYDADDGEAAIYLNGVLVASDSDLYTLNCDVEAVASGVTINLIEKPATTVKGKWVFNEVIDSKYAYDNNIGHGSADSLKFSSGGNLFKNMTFGATWSTITNIHNYHLIYWYETVETKENITAFTHSTADPMDTWHNEDFRTIDFGSTEQPVLDSFYAWLTANAKRQADPDVVSVIYIDNIIAEIEAGQTVILNCADKQMATDISITAPEIKEANLQEKTITENGEITPDNGYDGFSKVTIDVPIPDGYIIPTGTKEITENGTSDVTEFAAIEVNVPIPTRTQYAGSVTIKDLSISIINFTIDGTSYQAEEGMTWAEWVESDYNPN